MTSEADIQRAIIEALVYDGWLVLRINQGARQEMGRYVPFSYWSATGYGHHIDKGASDLLAIKARPATGPLCEHDYVAVLAIEVKAPGKKANVSHEQTHFLAAVEEHGGIAIVADCLEDVAPFLNRVEVQ